MKKRYSIIIMLAMILIAAPALSGCSKADIEENFAAVTIEITAIPTVTPTPITPTPEATDIPTLAPSLAPEIIEYNKIDYSSYTPIFVNYCLLAVVDGQKWIDPETLYPFEIYGYGEDYIEVNTSFIGDDETLYVYNENEQLYSVKGIETSYVMYWADGTTGLFIDSDFYEENYYATGAAKLTTTNPQMAIVHKVSLYTDQTSSIYTLDLDGDGVDEQVLCQNYMDAETKTEHYNFVISRGDTILYEIRREWEFSPYNPGDELSEEDIQYCMLNDYGNEYKAMFADVNNDGIYEIIDLTYTYGHHNCGMRIFSCVNGTWQKVGGEYIGD